MRILDLGVCAEKKGELTRKLGENVEITLLFESLLMRCPQVLKIEGVKKVCFKLILRVRQELIDLSLSNHFS